MKTSYKVTYAQAVHDDEEKQAVIDVLDSHETILGHRTKKFEDQVAKLFGKRYGIMVNSGSSANFLAVHILSLPAGSEVITPILTFATTVAPLVQHNLIPVFVDAELGTYQINIDQIERSITKKTRLLMIPSLLGNIPDLQKLRAMADRYNLIYIEDSCDTIGATFNSTPTGHYSDVSTSSFYGSHIITAGGGGGILCVNDTQHDRQARILRGWGRSSAVTESDSIDDRFDDTALGIPYDNKYIFE
ncbi:MAG: NDP-hexose 3,4-dehydratase, partial [Parcubacteria group bacterium GW2011_GWA2_47_8]